MGAEACCASEISQQELTHDPYTKPESTPKRSVKSIRSPKEPLPYQQSV